MLSLSLPQVRPAQPVRQNGHAVLTPAANEQVRDLTGRTYLSFSQVNGFRMCPRKWAYHYVEDATPAFTPQSLLFGSAFHHALESHFLAKMEGRSLTPAQVVDAFKGYLTDPANVKAPLKYGAKDNQETLFALGERMVLAFLASPLANPAGDIVFIEENLQAPVAPDLPDIVAKVDLGIIGLDGVLTVLDFKTSRSKWNPAGVAEHADQLLLYRLLALHRNPDEQIRLKFAVVTKAVAPVVQDLEVAYDAKTAGRVIDSMRPVWAAMKAQAYFPAPSAMNCGGCPYSHLCPAYRGAGGGEGGAD